MSRRSLMLLSLVAVTGLALAGYGLLTAEGTSPREVPPQAIARVNDRLILRTDHVTQLEMRFGIPYSEATSEQRRQVLDDMIDEELLVQRGLAENLPAYDPHVRAALVRGMEQQIFAEVLARHPSEDDLRRHYEKHKAKYVQEGEPRRRKKFDDASNQVWADLKWESRQAAREAHIRQLREEADVQIAESE